MSTDESQWRLEMPGGLIHANEVHVWRVFLDMTVTQRDILLGVLSEDEVGRATRLHFERDRNRFIAARGTLRHLLGRYLGKHPQELRFEYSSHGKPVLTNHSGDDTLSFNLSHSGAYGLYAVTRGRNIGIDIEHVRDDVAVEQIARRFFSQSEIRSLERLHQDKRTGVFFQYWTRKEAFLKARGEGVTFPMELCDVSLLNGNVMSPISCQGDNRESTCWYGQDLFPGPGYVAAIAVEGGDWDLTCWQYAV